MISVYNETKLCWNIDAINTSVIRLSKSKEVRDNKVTIKKKSINIIMYRQLIKQIDEFNSFIAKTRQTSYPVTIANSTTAVIFNDKEFKPFVTERNYNLKNILLGSLFLEGKKVINVINNNTFMLEFFLLGAEFSFITSFNSPSASLRIDLLDQKTNVITQYEFFQSNTGNIELNITTRPAIEAERTTKYRVRSFRPSKPTKLILVHYKDIEALDEVVDTSKHTIVCYTNLEESVAALVKDNYKAITLFSKSKMRAETPEEKRRYDYVTRHLNKRFQTVFKLHIDGKVDKLQY